MAVAEEVFLIAIRKEDYNGIHKKFRRTREEAAVLAEFLRKQNRLRRLSDDSFSEEHLDNTDSRKCEKRTENLSFYIIFQIAEAFG